MILSKLFNLVILLYLIFFLPPQCFAQYKLFCPFDSNSVNNQYLLMGRQFFVSPDRVINIDDVMLIFHNDSTDRRLPFGRLSDYVFYGQYGGDLFETPDLKFEKNIEFDSLNNVVRFVSMDTKYTIFINSNLQIDSLFSLEIGQYPSSASTRLRKLLYNYDTLLRLEGITYIGLEKLGGDNDTLCTVYVTYDGFLIKSKTLYTYNQGDLFPVYRDYYYISSKRKVTYKAWLSTFKVRIYHLFFLKKYLSQIDSYMDSIEDFSYKN